MDPNEALRKARAAAKVIIEAESANEHEDSAEKLADAFDALDEWFSKGGFLPDAWKAVGRVR